MYGSKHGIVWALLVVMLFVAIPLSVVLWRRGPAWWKIPPVGTVSSLGALALLVVVLIEVTVRRPAGDGASAPKPRTVIPPDTIVPEEGAAPRLGLARKAPD